MIDDNEDGNVDYYFGKPDFNVKTFLSNLVLRWEYLPGSTVYLIWAHHCTAILNLCFRFYRASNLISFHIPNRPEGSLVFYTRLVSGIIIMKN